MSGKQFALLCPMILCCALTLHAQETKCALKSAQLAAAPELRGFRLGMTLEQFRARVPNLAIRQPDEFGATAINIYPEHEDKIDRATFEGIRTVSLEFLDGRVVSLWVGYAPDFKWKSPDEFLAGISRALALPDAWVVKSRGKQLSCEDFQVTVSSIGGNPSLRIVDESARRTLEARKAAKEEASEPQ